MRFRFRKLGGTVDGSPGTHGAGCFMAEGPGATTSMCPMPAPWGPFVRLLLTEPCLGLEEGHRLFSCRPSREPWKNGWWIFGMLPRPRHPTRLGGGRALHVSRCIPRAEPSHYRGAGYRSCGTALTDGHREQLNPADIIQDVGRAAFSRFRQGPGFDLQPRRTIWRKIDEINDYVLRTINNGVYLTGFRPVPQPGFMRRQRLEDVRGLRSCSTKRFEPPALSCMEISILESRSPSLSPRMILFSEPVYYAFTFKCNVRPLSEYPEPTTPHLGCSGSLDGRSRAPPVSRPYRRPLLFWPNRPHQSLMESFPAGGLLSISTGRIWHL